MIELLAKEFALDPLFLQVLLTCSVELNDLPRFTSFCAELTQSLAAFPSNPLTRTPLGRLTYTRNFIAYFLSSWQAKLPIPEMRDLYEKVLDLYEGLLP